MPRPPGGRLTCAPGQTPIIEVINGEVFASCVAYPPRRSKDTNAQINWLLERVTGAERDEYQRLRDEDLSIVRSGHHRYVDRQGRKVEVYFKFVEQNTGYLER